MRELLDGAESEEEVLTPESLLAKLEALAEKVRSEGVPEASPIYGFWSLYSSFHSGLHRSCTKS